MNKRCLQSPHTVREKLTPSDNGMRWSPIRRPRPSSGVVILKPDSSLDSESDIAVERKMLRMPIGVVDVRSRGQRCSANRRQKGTSSRARRRTVRTATVNTPLPMGDKANRDRTSQNKSRSGKSWDAGRHADRPLLYREPSDPKIHRIFLTGPRAALNAAYRKTAGQVAQNRQIVARAVNAHH